jgi:hypothetical protein
MRLQAICQHFTRISAEGQVGGGYFWIASSAGCARY